MAIEWLPNSTVYFWVFGSALAHEVLQVKKIACVEVVNIEHGRCSFCSDRIID